MSGKSLSVTKWINTVVIKPTDESLCICSITKWVSGTTSPGKMHKQRTVSGTFSITQQRSVCQRGQAELQQQTCSSIHLCVKQRSANVLSKRLLSPNKKTARRWLDDETLKNKCKSTEKETNLTFKRKHTYDTVWICGKWDPKIHLQLRLITIAATKENKTKIFEIVTLNL